MYFLGRSITIIVSGVVRCCSVLDASSMLFVVPLGVKSLTTVLATLMVFGCFSVVAIKLEVLETFVSGSLGFDGIAVCVLCVVISGGGKVVGLCVVEPKHSRLPRTKNDSLLVPSTLNSNRFTGRLRGSVKYPSSMCHLLSTMSQLHALVLTWQVLLTPHAHCLLPGAAPDQ